MKKYCSYFRTIFFLIIKYEELMIKIIIIPYIDRTNVKKLFKKKFTIKNIEKIKKIKNNNNKDSFKILIVIILINFCFQ